MRPPRKRRKTEQVDFSVAMPLEILWLIMDALPAGSLWRLRNTSARLRAMVTEYLPGRLHGEDAWWAYDQIIYCFDHFTKNDGLEFWLKFGVDVNWNGSVLLQCAVGYKQISTVEMLLKAGAKVDNDAILQSAVERFGKPAIDIVRLLLTHGASARNPELIGFAVRMGNVSIAKMLLEHGADVHADDNQLLIGAVVDDNLRMVKVLLHFHADVRAWDDLCIQNAATWSCYAIVKALIDHGADVNANDGDALIKAALRGRTKIVKLLVDHGAEVTAQNSQAFRHAANKGHEDIVRLLVSKGANVDAVRSEALRFAAFKGHTRTVKVLRERRSRRPCM